MSEEQKAKQPQQQVAFLDDLINAAGAVAAAAAIAKSQDAQAKSNKDHKDCYTPEEIKKMKEELAEKNHVVRDQALDLVTGGLFSLTQAGNQGKVTGEAVNIMNLDVCGPDGKPVKKDKSGQAPSDQHDEHGQLSSPKTPTAKADHGGRAA